MDVCPARKRKLMARNNLNNFSLLCVGLVITTIGCNTAKYRAKADKEVYGILENKRMLALNRSRPFTVERKKENLRRRILRSRGKSYFEDTGNPPGQTQEGENDLLSSMESKANQEQEVAPQPVDEIKTILSLRDALLVAGENSRSYQDQKENLYLSALDLTLERHNFSNLFTSILFANVEQTDSDNRNVGIGGDISMSRRLASGGRLVTSLGLSAVKVFSGGLDSETVAALEAELVQPLLRGAGKKIVLEDLIQTERDVIYAVQRFARFQKVFAVSIISDYYNVLELNQIVSNEYQNYQNLTASRQRAEALFQAGRLPEIQVGQTRQNELSARNRWIVARQRYEAALDLARVTLGLPTDSEITLDQSELERLKSAGLEEKVVDTPAGIDTALNTRLDHLVSLGEMEDAKRKVVVAKDGFRPDLDLTLTSSVASRRPNHVADLRFKNGSYSAGLLLGLPLNRKAERNLFREAEINLARSVRALEATRENIKVGVRDAARRLTQARESYLIQQNSVQLAQQRVEAANLLLDAGRAESRDLLEAQDALVNAQNALIGAIVDHTIADLEFIRDTGELAVDELGIPQSFPWAQ